MLFVKLQTLLFATLLIITKYSTKAAPADTTNSLVVTTTESSENKKLQKENSTNENAPKIPKIYQMNVKSQVSNRYANTTISSKVKNAGSKPQEATFSVVLPETAFISGFVMEVDGKNYTAYVKEKEEAQKAYDTAIASGLGAAHVFVSARDSNRFTVSVNVEPETKAAFYLNYEELLKREDGHYELVINLYPGQPVKDLNVEVDISESRKIINLKAPPIRSGNEMGNEDAELDPRATIEVVNDTAAVVRFIPSLERQKQLATILGTDENQGLAGQFVVQYDVERDPKGGEFLVQDGYCVHFFAPSDISPLPKRIVFVLDTSYSMVGEKIAQLKEAMSKILGELKDHDLFNLVEFNTNVKVWNLDNTNDSVWYPTENEDSLHEGEVEEHISNYTFPNAYKANPDNIEKAKTTVTELEPNRGTDIHNALSVGLHLIEMAKKQNNGSSNPQPMIVFLTDGDPTIGITSPEEIITKISKYNSESRTTPIFALSFGDGAYKNFLQKLSLRNSGFSRHIYEAADASLQLQDFYRQISSPLLSNVSFKYEPTTTSLTKTEFPIHFGGSELVVAGWCGTDAINPSVEGWGIYGNIHFTPVVERPVFNIERLWAYLTVQQLLEKKEATDKDQDELKMKALDLALKYSFVTPVSSLVVVKPNDTNSVDTETAAKAPGAFPLSGAPGAACPEYPMGKCAYEKDCPVFSRHGICSADKNYIALVCCTYSGTTNVLNYYVAREFPDRTQCGRSRNLNQIYNGTETREYPWVAALLYIATKNTMYGGVKCGGTLITEKFVLTAAHCFINETAESIRVLLGDWNMTSDPDTFPATVEIEYAPKVINATIDKIISHELYRPKTKRNDIALLRLKTPVDFTDYVRPICLPSKDFPALTSGVEVVVAGWGITEIGSQSDILLQATLHVLTNNECLEKIKKTGEIDETEFCAAHGDSGACGGDSGGPLMSSYKDYHSNWFQLGIVESGGSCSSFGATATIYTRVSSFVEWIMYHIRPRSERDSPCITPDNEKGTCVPVHECSVLEQQYLQPGSSSEVEFIRRSLCGYIFEEYGNRTETIILNYYSVRASDMVCCRLSQIKRENAMENSSCKTPKPESKDGTCVRITNCPALNNASKAARENIEKYQCGFDDKLLVCCKTQDIVVAYEPKYLEEFSIANIPNRTICGQIRSNNTKSEYPWLAALMYSDPAYPLEGYLLFCGGSLINKRFVLTAGSCFYRIEKFFNYRVLLGTGFVNGSLENKSDYPSNIQNLTVEQRILHPFYDYSHSLNDIALVRLGSDVVFNDYVSPVCLPPLNLQPLRGGTEVTMATWAGWQEIDVITQVGQSCIENPDFRTVHKQELCIRRNDTTSKFCEATRGGSIVKAHKDQLGQNLFLEGIYLARLGCSDLNLYNKNVRISAYTSWILRTITKTT